MLDGWVRDLRYGSRSLTKQPGFAAVALLTIGLGIGASSTIFSLVSGILLRPLPYPEPDRLVAVWPGHWYSKPLFQRLEASSDSYEALAGWAPRAHILIGDDGARRLWGPRVTARFLDVLGNDVATGRAFQAGDDKHGADVVVISYRLWQSLYGGDPAVIGKRVQLSGVDRTIVGVLERGSDFMQRDADIAVPQLMEPDAPGWGASELQIVGRLAAGVSLDQAEAEFRALAVRWRQEFDLPDDWGADARVVPLRQFLIGDTRPTMLLLFAAAGLILLIASANVANLLLARSLGRRREVTVRLALGASRPRLVRQLLTESTLLGLAGGLIGLGAATFGLDAVVALFPADTPRLGEVRIDGLVLAFTATLALITGWIVGVTPAWQATKSDLREGLGGEGRGTTDTRGRRRLRAAIAMGEVALAFTLLVGSGLLIKSLWQVSRVDPGFRPTGLLTFDLVPEHGRLDSHEQAQAYYAALNERLEAIPGVGSAAYINTAPLAPDGAIVSLYRPDRPPAPGTRLPIARWRAASLDYFRTAGISLLAGRDFQPGDVAGAPQVTVLSRSAADALFPDGDALGNEVIGGLEDQGPLTVVGIAGDVKINGLDQESPLVFYRPYAQVGATARIFRSHSRSLLLRTRGDPEALATTVRDAVRSVDPNALISRLRTMPHAISDSLTRRRVTMIVLSIFAATALLLGAIGVYGVMGYTVQQRTREIGIRVALGASGSLIVRRILRDGLSIAALGTTAGLAISLALSRMLRGFVFDISTVDPVVLLAACGVAVGFALTATLLPARRATLVDPVEALSSE
jgi:putative ABC transport system permease protein